MHQRDRDVIILFMEARPEVVPEYAALFFQADGIFEANRGVSGPEADRARIDAAHLYQRAAGYLIYEELTARGLHDNDILELTPAEVEFLAHDAMGQVQLRVQDLCPEAKEALRRVAYQISGEPRPAASHEPAPYSVS